MVKNEFTVHTLSEEECRTLLLIIEEQHGLALAEDEFVEVVLGLFENIPGFETMTLEVSQQHLNELWSLYMGKKPAAGTSVMSAKADVTTSKPVEVDLNQPIIRAAIEQGQALIAEGKTKADAARAIYNEIKDEPKEVIIAAFVVGATLTEKGALTYWYNCRRKAAKETARSKTGSVSGS